MKCVNCGAELKEGNVFCNNCGKETQIVPDYNVFEDEYLKKLLEEQSQKEDATENAVEEKKSEAPKTSKKAIIAVVISALVVLVVIVVALIVVNNTKNANSIVYQMEHAKEAYNNGNYEDAITFYENALKIDPDSSEAKLALAAIYLTQKDNESAYVLLAEVIKSDSSNKEAYKMMIDLLASQDKVDDIIKLSENVTDLKVLELFEDYLVVPPAFSSDAGTYEEYLEISLKSSSNYEIYYTVDGTDPIKKGVLYDEPISLEDLVEDDEDEFVIKAVCLNDNGVYSEVVEAKYVIDLQAPDMPEVTPDGGNVKADQKVTVTVPEDCVAFYTWDGTTPNVSSPKYTEPLEIPEGDNVLSVVIMNEKTEKFSNTYRGHFVFYK